jgi:hypothetical protein
MVARSTPRTSALALVAGAGGEGGGGLVAIQQRRAGEGADQRQAFPGGKHRARFGAGPGGEAGQADDLPVVVQGLAVRFRLRLVALVVQRQLLHRAPVHAAGTVGGMQGCVASRAPKIGAADGLNA